MWFSVTFSQQIEHGLLHNVLNLDDITLQILDLDNLSESYGSKLRCRSLWDTLYISCLLFPTLRQSQRNWTSA